VVNKSKCKAFRTLKLSVWEEEKTIGVEKGLKWDWGASECEKNQCRCSLLRLQRLTFWKTWVYSQTCRKTTLRILTICYKGTRDMLQEFKNEPINGFCFPLLCVGIEKKIDRIGSCVQNNIHLKNHQTQGFSSSQVFPTTSSTPLPLQTKLLFLHFTAMKLVKHQKKLNLEKKNNI